MFLHVQDYWKPQIASVRTLRNDVAIESENGTTQAQSNVRAASSWSRPEHPDAKHVCQVCGRKFTAQCGVRQHLKTVHRLGDVKSFPCEVCGRIFIRLYTLRLHLRTVHSVGDVCNFHCDNCSKSFKEKGALKRHLIAMHSIGDVKTFPCDICAKSFKRKEHLKKHLSSVHGVGDVKKFQCSVCLTHEKIISSSTPSALRESFRFESSECCTLKPRRRCTVDQHCRWNLERNRHILFLT